MNTSNDNTNNAADTNTNTNLNRDEWETLAVEEQCRGCEGPSDGCGCAYDCGYTPSWSVCRGGTGEPSTDGSLKFIIWGLLDHVNFPRWMRSTFEEGMKDNFVKGLIDLHKKWEERYDHITEGPNTPSHMKAARHDNRSVRWSEIIAKARDDAKHFESISDEGPFAQNIFDLIEREADKLLLVEAQKRFVYGLVTSGKFQWSQCSDIMAAIGGDPEKLKHFNWGERS